jgi:hypothetical protein
MMCFTTANSYSKGRSPWNFSEDFENEKVGRLRTNKFTTNDKGTGRKPFKIRKDPDGNQYLEVTVKDGWNTDYDYTDPKQKRKETERAEFQTIQKRALDKEMWISFKTRLPQDFTHIDDRVLFFQFKNQFEQMKRSPLLGIRFYKDGDVMKIGGETGGNATKSRSKEEKYIHIIGAKYKKKRGRLGCQMGKR